MVTLMSKGISTRQQLMLGIAYGVNLLTGHSVKGIVRPDWHNDCLSYEGIPDLNWQLVAHILDGIPFDLNYDDARYFVYDAKAKSSKASIIRALKSLIKHDLIKYCSASNHHWGFVLTEKGFAVGKEHQQPVPAEALILSGITNKRSRLYHLANYKLNNSTLEDIQRSPYVGRGSKGYFEILAKADLYHKQKTA